MRRIGAKMAENIDRDCDSRSDESIEKQLTVIDEAIDNARCMEQDTILWEKELQELRDQYIARFETYKKLASEKMQEQQCAMTKSNVEKEELLKEVSALRLQAAASQLLGEMAGMQCVTSENDHYHTYQMSTGPMKGHKFLLEYIEENQEYYYKPLEDHSTTANTDLGQPFYFPSSMLQKFFNKLMNSNTTDM